MYFTSLGLIFVGIFYLWLIPESVEKPKEKQKEGDSNNNNEVQEREENVASKLWTSFKGTNKLFVETLKYIFRSLS